MTDKKTSLSGADNALLSPDRSERLQKYLAACGVASRRAAEELILAGRVSVNGKTAALGCKVIPGQDQILLDGLPVQLAERLRYILLHKPTGYICSAHDEKGRRTVLDLISGVEERIYPVGRLDYDTGGLLLLTNDGELTNRLLHPSHEVEKTYLAQVEKALTRTELEQLRKGLRLADGLTAPARVRQSVKPDGRVLVELTIHEGRNRQVRRMLEAVGHPVLRLKRIRLAGLTLEGLPLGQWRELRPDEVAALKAI